MSHTAAGRVLSLHRFPLKSADGESVPEVEVSPTGLAQDRRWAVTRPDGSLVTAKQAPRLRRVRARAVAGSLVVEPGLDTVVEGPFELRDAAGTHQQVAAVHLVSRGADGAADAPAGCDPRPRANVVLDLPEPGAERAWVGRVLHLGDVTLRITRTPSTCLGVYAEVVVPGVLRVGDRLTLRD